MTPYRFGQKIAAGPSFWSDYTHQLNKFYNPWSDAWNEPAKDNLEKGLQYAGRTAMGVGATAGLAAGGIAAAPALSSAGGTALNTARVVGGAASNAARMARPVANTAYKAYQTASTPLTVHGAKLLPQSIQSVAVPAAKATALGMTGMTAYDTYQSAADATSSSAQQLARQAGVNDDAVLKEIGSRARGQMLPMAYRSVAPSWLGGDSSPMGAELRKGLGTIAYHNVGPSMLLPSPSAVNASPMQRTINAVYSNPLGAVTSAVLPARPNAQQMWNNVPTDQQKQIGQNIFSAATSPDTAKSPLANSMSHVFQPAVDYHAKNLSNSIANVTNAFGGNSNFGGFGGSLNSSTFGLNGMPGFAKTP